MTLRALRFGPLTKLSGSRLRLVHEGVRHARSQRGQRLAARRLVSGLALEGFQFYRRACAMTLRIRLGSASPAMSAIGIQRMPSGACTSAGSSVAYTLSSSGKWVKTWRTIPVRRRHATTLRRFDEPKRGACCRADIHRNRAPTPSSALQSCRQEALSPAVCAPVGNRRPAEQQRLHRAAACLRAWVFGAERSRLRRVRGRRSFRSTGKRRKPVSLVCRSSRRDPSSLARNHRRAVAG